KNPNVYVSGLPSDISLEEVEKMFKRAGIIKIDPDTTRPKIRLYCNPINGNCKGDALVSFVREESVGIAVKYLNDSEIRPNCKVKVEQAHFSERVVKNSEIDIAGASTKIDRRKYLAAKYEQERLMSWGEDVDDGSGRRIVLFKPMFSAAEAEMYHDGDTFYEELKEEITAEVKKYVPVERVTPIARHPQGIIVMKFKSTAHAETAIERFQDRLFAGNQLDVYFYDGKTDLKSQCLPSTRSSIMNEQSEDKHHIPEKTNSAKKRKKENLTAKSSNLQEVVLPLGQTNEETSPTMPVILSESEKNDIERMDEFGSWLEEQSSDEEFVINSELGIEEE
ncbi:Rna recognition motif-containing protein, partial [Cardiosporidium cionae]